LARDDNGEILDAEFSVVQDGGHLDLILESAGGASADRQARNTAYRTTLGVLLARLRGLGAVIDDALVDSRYTREAGIAPADRRLIDGPVQLVDVDDLDSFRLLLTSRQIHVGQAPGARGGNSTKRIRLRLTVPGYTAGDADRLAERLANRLLPSPTPPTGAGGAKHYWWSNLPAERSWVEIRRVQQGLGQELRCPFINAIGRRDGWWELVDDVHVGDCIYHWNATQGRFIGRSFAATTRQADPNTGQRVVRLRDFLPLIVDVGLEQVRAWAPRLEAERDAIAEQYPDSTLYLPFQFRSDGLRLMSNYFAKLPLAMQQVLFGSDGLAQSGLPAPQTEDQDDGEPEGGLGTGGRPGGFLSPFKPRADADYVSNVAGGPFRRSRKHETLVNDFARWLSDRGLEAASNAAIDLGLVQPPVIIEAKVIRGERWATAIREAVGQLYEYRYFQVVAPESKLLFLASAKVPQKWLDYLDQDRQIGAAWRAADDFQLTLRARAALCIEL
jgi:hypothetical protein